MAVWNLSQKRYLARKKLKTLGLGDYSTYLIYSQIFAVFKFTAAEQTTKK